MARFSSLVLTSLQIVALILISVGQYAVSQRIQGPGPAVLSIIPDNSQSSWSLRDFPGVNAQLNPSAFQLAGPVALSIDQVDRGTGQPTKVSFPLVPKIH